MMTDRRKFLSTLLAALPAGRVAMCGDTLPAVINAPIPRVINYNEDGRAEIVEGRTLLVSLVFPIGVGLPKASFPIEIETAAGHRLVEEQRLFFYPAGDGRTFRTILSAPLDAVPGEYPLKLILGGGGGGHAALSAPGEEIATYRVTPGVYRRSALRLSRTFSAPPPAVSERLRREFETMVKIYRARTPRRWRRKFIRSVAASDANNFGVRRIVNNSKRYRHAGLDYRAPLGTPVRAVNDGIVVLSTIHWTPGQLICIDHGGGLFSRYIHLSERRVRRGDRVRRGQVIALSGRSGSQRTRPHLHVDIIVNGTPVSPASMRQTTARLLAVEAAAAATPALMSPS